MVSADMGRIPKTIPAEKIGLPTAGAVIDSIIERDKDARHWKVDGRILSINPSADPIRFRMLIPQGPWNERMLHIGGGGLDGFIPFMGSTGVGLEMWHGAPAPVARGYVVYSSDSGHSSARFGANGMFMDSTADFSFNDEMLVNYAHDAIKKTHDAAATIVRAVYGRDPEHSYFAGSSNGGRGALLAAQRYGADYDGIICGYPAIFWVGQMLMGHAILKAELEAGEEGFIDAETWAAVDREVLGSFDAADGLEDGLICNYGFALAGETGLREQLSAILNPAQMRLVEACTGEVDYSFADNDAFASYPCFSLPFGEPLRDDHAPLMVLNGLSSAPGAFDGFLGSAAREVIPKLILRQRDYDVFDFVPAEHTEELERASRLFDALDLEFTDFRAHGGKAILYHGTYDQLVPVRATIMYYEALLKRHGREALRDFMRLHIVPGLGHSIGRFDMGLDLLGALDEWTSEGKAPDGLVAQNRREDYGPREMPLCEWPLWPRYVDGDPDCAGSYEASDGE